MKKQAKDLRPITMKSLNLMAMTQSMGIAKVIEARGK